MNGSYIKLLHYTSFVFICADQAVADHAALGWHRTKVWLHITVNAM